MKIEIDPKLPAKFDSTDNEHRPMSHLRWWYRPYIETATWESWNSTDEDRKAKWFAAWPSGTRYAVRCLDGGAWDRSTNRGMFGTLEEAMEVATAIAEGFKNHRITED
jgi:hypothetical protein